jgi:hypothetical protein
MQGRYNSYAWRLVQLQIGGKRCHFLKVRVSVGKITYPTQKISASVGISSPNPPSRTDLVIGSALEGTLLQDTLSGARNQKFFLEAYYVRSAGDVASYWGAS